MIYQQYFTVDLIFRSSTHVISDLKELVTTSGYKIIFRNYDTDESINKNLMEEVWADLQAILSFTKQANLSMDEICDVNYPSTENVDSVHSNIAYSGNRYALLTQLHPIGERIVKLHIK